MKSLFTLALMVALAPMLASGQSVQTFTIDPYPSGNPTGSAGYAALEKVVGFFNSTTMPSVVVGMNGNRGKAGMYLYTSSSGNLSGPWVRTAIDPVGDFYEGSAAFTNPGDTYPGICQSSGTSSRSGCASEPSAGQSCRDRIPTPRPRSGQRCRGD